MGRIMVGTNTRKKRIKLGQCIRCAKPRGEDGTGTLCRTCANLKAAKVRDYRDAPPNHLRNENGFIVLKCENCFDEFPWEGSGQRTMCDSCLPWFDTDRNNSGIDHEREQEQARKAKAISATSIIEHWQRQG